MNVQHGGKTQPQRNLKQAHIKDASYTDRYIAPNESHKNVEWAK